MKDRIFYGKRTSIIAIICNIFLFGGKIAVGLILGVTAIVADAFNNLSDFGSNVVSLIGFAVSGKPADKEHPFGHARAEYVGAMIVALVVVVLGIELIITAVKDIISPTEFVFSVYMIIILAISIVVKLFMFFYNRAVAKKIDSQMLSAVATDSISDCIATGAILISIIISYYTGVNLDAYMTIVVALFVLTAGLKILFENISDLLGKAPSPQLVKDIKAKILDNPEVLGVHDLFVHDYGHGKIVASAHAEVDASIPIMESHDTIDLIERSFAPDILMTIHLDPIEVKDEKVNTLRAEIEEIVESEDKSITMHDFRVVFGTTHSNLIFDIVVPFECKKSKAQLIENIDAKVKQLNPTYNTVITIDQE